MSDDTPTRADLIERLRSVDVSWSEVGEWCAEAAAALTADAERIAALEGEVVRLRKLIKWVKYCDGLGTFRKTDCREVVISFEDSDAGMTFFERMSDFIDAARAALKGTTHD